MEARWALVALGLATVFAADIFFIVINVTSVQADGQRAFDIDRVRLMEPADLPDDVPVPVPFGGEIEDTIAPFEGQSLHVTDDARIFATAAAFYEAWFVREGLSASPLLNFADPYAGWEVNVDGEPVRVQMALSPDEAQTQLTITWD